VLDGEGDESFSELRFEVPQCLADDRLLCSRRDDDVPKVHLRRQRNSRRQNPARARSRPTTLFRARRAIRFGSPDASASRSSTQRAARKSVESRRGRLMALVCSRFAPPRGRCGGLDYKRPFALTVRPSPRLTVAATRVRPAGTLSKVDVVWTSALTGAMSTAHVPVSPPSRRCGSEGPMEAPAGCRAISPGRVATRQDMTVTGRRPTFRTSTETIGRMKPWDASIWASSTVKGAPRRRVMSPPGPIAPGRNSALTLPPSRKKVAACHPNEAAARTRLRTAIASVAASKLTLLAAAHRPPNLTHKLTHKLVRFVGQS